MHFMHIGDVYSHVTTTTVKTQDTFITTKDSSCPSEVSPSCDA